MGPSLPYDKLSRETQGKIPSSNKAGRTGKARLGVFSLKLRLLVKGNVCMVVSSSRLKEGSPDCLQEQGSNASGRQAVIVVEIFSKLITVSSGEITCQKVSRQDAE